MAKRTRAAEPDAREDTGRPEGDASKRKRPSRPKRPEGFPIRPPTAYFMFVHQNRQRIKDSNPNATAPEMAKLSGSEWGRLQESERANWQQQAKEATRRYREEVKQWRRDHPDAARAMDEERSKSSKTRGTRPPKRSPSAYLLFSQMHRASRQEENGSASSKPRPARLQQECADEWRILPLEEKQQYLQKADELKAEWKESLANWKELYPERAAELGLNDDDAATEESDVSEGGTHYGKKRKNTQTNKVAKRTISDDEREYNEMVQEYGQNLLALRPDPIQISMASLADDEVQGGRASQRTFELDRVREKQLEDARTERRAQTSKLLRDKAALREKLAKVRSGEQVDLPRRAEPAALASMEEMQDDADTGQAQDGDEEDVEEELGGGRRKEAFEGVRDLEEDEEGRRRRQGREAESGNVSDEDGAVSEAGSVRTHTSAGTMPSLHETNQAVQMRFVDGRMVIDESSLHVSRTEEQVFEEADMVEEVAGHKFVNSSTNGKKSGLKRTPRWTADETDEFFRAVSMWGTDFEMIARMFPNRDRKQIKHKWNREDRSNGARLDQAFRRKLSVNVKEYSVMANVDLSGPPPEVAVKADEEMLRIKKDDEEAKRLKMSQTPDPQGLKSRQHAGDQDDGEGAAGGSDAENDVAEAPRDQRASSAFSARSNASTAKGRGGGGGGGPSTRSAAGGSTRASERELREQRELQRRRRSASRGATNARDDGRSRANEAGHYEEGEEEVEDLPADWAV